MNFTRQLQERSAEVYADFLLPHLSTDLLLDVGCGSGSITLGLGAYVQEVHGIERDPREYRDAEAHAHRVGLDPRPLPRRMRDAWLEWAVSAQSYVAFAWCRAFGWKADTQER